MSTQRTLAVVVFAGIVSAGLSGGALGQAGSAPLTSDGLGQLTASQVETLAKSLLSQTTPPQADLRTLADFVAGKVAAPGADGKLDAALWRRAVSLESYMSAAAREALLTKARTAYAAATSLGAAKRADVETVKSLREKLGDAQAADLMARWTLTATEWEAYDGQRLAAMAGKLPASDLGREARVKVASVAKSKMLGDVAAIKASKPMALSLLVRAVVDNYDAETRTAIAARIVQAYSDDQALASLAKPLELQEVVGALRALGSTAGEDLSARWVLRNVNALGSDPDQIAKLAVAVRGKGKSSLEARAKLAEYVISQWFGTTAPAAGGATLSEEGARKLVTALVPGLSPELAMSLRNGFRGKYMPAVATLKFDDLKKWTWEGAPDRPARATLVASWITASPALAATKAIDQLSLLKDLVGQGGDLAVARRKLVDSLSEKIQKDAAELRGLPLDQVLVLGTSMSLDQRSVLVLKVHEVYDNAALLKDLKYEDMRGLIYLLTSMEDKTVARTIALYLASSEGWKKAPAVHLGQYALAMRTRASWNEEARKQLLAHVSATLLTDAKAAQAVDVAVWKNLAGLVDGAPADVQAKWATSLQGAFFASEQQLLAIKSTPLVVLVDLLAKLDRGQAGEVSWTWLRRAPDRAQAPIRDLMRLAYHAAGKPNLSAADKVAMLGEIEKFETAASAPVTKTLDDVLSKARLYNLLGNKVKHEQWTRQAYALAVGTAEAQKAVSTHQLGLVAAELGAAGLTGHGEEYPEYAAAISAKAANGSLTHLVIPDMLIVGKVLAGTQTRQALEAGMVSKDGVPYPIAPSFTAWAYRSAKDVDAYVGRLDQKLADTHVAGDAKASWLIARGFADAASPVDYDARRLGQWMDKALAAAVSESARIDVLRELLREASPDRALSVLTSIQGQFSPEKSGVIRLWIAELQDRKWAKDVEAKQLGAEADRTLAIELLEQCKRSLVGARAKGDAELVERLEQQIRALEAASNK